MNCKCGNFGCAVRLARGLKPFCDGTLTSGRGEKGFSSYAVAAERARAVGGRVRCVRVSGGPKAFIVESR